MKFFNLALAAGAVAFTASSATAVTIVIDDFSTFQQVIDVPTPGAVNSNVEMGIGDLSADRAMSVVTSGGGLGASTFTSTGASGFVPSNSVTLSNSPGQSSVATITYTFGSSVDLTSGGFTDKFFFEFPGGILSGDVIGTNFSTTVVSGAGTGTDVEALTPFSSPFLSFSDADFAAVDFEDVTSLMFTFESSESFDGALNSISVVPVPAAGLLLLGGLGAFAAVGRRRRRQS